MMSILLWISFLLHFVLIATIYYLYKEIRLVKNSNSNDDVTKLMETYLEEIKVENDRLQQSLMRLPIADNSEVLERANAAEKKLITADSPLVNNDGIGDRAEASLHARILQRYAEGATVDEIAKDLKCGKTETELIIKLYAKKRK